MDTDSSKMTTEPGRVRLAGANKSQFPEVEGGGSLIVAWQIKNKNVLVIGGGEVAAGRILNCLNADARVTVVCPSSGLNPEVAHRVACRQVWHIDRVFREVDLDALPTPENTPPCHPANRQNNTGVKAADNSIAMVLCAIDDPAASTSVWKACLKRRIPANIADVPPECDFYFGSTHRDGPLQIMVSTNGRGPRVAAQIRKRIAQMLPRGTGAAIDRVGGLRERLRDVAPGKEEGPKRMRWMIRVSDKFTWAQLERMTREDMSNLLGFWGAGVVPSWGELMAMREERTFDEDDDVLEWSFGFSVGC